MLYATTMKQPKTIPEFFKAVRVSRDITQAGLAELIGTSQMYVAHIEQGKYVLPMETLAKLMPVLTKSEKAQIEEIVKDISVQMLRGNL